MLESPPHKDKDRVAEDRDESPDPAQGVSSNVQRNNSSADISSAKKRGRPRKALMTKHFRPTG